VVGNTASLARPGRTELFRGPRLPGADLKRQIAARPEQGWDLSKQTQRPVQPVRAQRAARFMRTSFCKPMSASDTAGSRRRGHRQPPRDERRSRVSREQADALRQAAERRFRRQCRAAPTHPGIHRASGRPMPARPLCTRPCSTPAIVGDATPSTSPARFTSVSVSGLGISARRSQDGATRTCPADDVRPLPRIAPGKITLLAASAVTTSAATVWRRHVRT
jgi:hypothetical protein